MHLHETVEKMAHNSCVIHTETIAATMQHLCVSLHFAYLYVFACQVVYNVIVGCTVLIEVVALECL